MIRVINIYKFTKYLQFCGVQVGLFQFPQNSIHVLLFTKFQTDRTFSTDFAVVVAVVVVVFSTDSKFKYLQFPTFPPFVKGSQPLP